MSSEAIEVAAEVIEPSSALEVACTPAVLSDNIAALSAWVDAKIAPYAGTVIDPQDGEQVKVARNIMAELNRIKKPIEDERKRVKREYEAPLKAFEGRVKEITAKIDSARAAIKAQVDEADAMFRESRRQMLQEEYEGCAGALASVIPFPAILEEQWLNRSTMEPKAVGALCDKAQRALEGYEAITAQDMPHKDEAVMRYAQTLDLAQALAYGRELAERDREMAEFKAAQEAAAAVKAEREPEAAPEPAPEPSPVPVPVFRWSLQMEFAATRAHAQDVAMTLRQMGVTGASLQCTGVVEHG